MADPRHDLGSRAEAAVAQRLRLEGWQICARRWRTAEGEVDLVALDPDHVLVGIEVRGRSSPRSGTALESVDRRHLGRLRAALVSYALSVAPEHRGLRIDLVTLDAGASGWRMVRYPAIDAW